MAMISIFLVIKINGPKFYFFVKRPKLFIVYCQIRTIIL